MTGIARASLVLFTRPAGEADPLVAAARAVGLRVAAVPTVMTQPAADGGPLDAAIADLGRWDWIVITSPAGARAVGVAIRRTGATLGHRVRWAAVGPATAEVLAGIGVAADLVPAKATGAALAAAMASAGLSGRRVLLARADAASDDLPKALGAAGAMVDEVTAYHTIEAPPAFATALAAALADELLAAIVVASGSAVRGLVRLASGARSGRDVLTVPLISIGPSTSAVARVLGFEQVVEARQPSVGALLDTIRQTVPLDGTLTATAGRTG